MGFFDLFKKSGKQSRPERKQEGTKVPFPSRKQDNIPPAVQDSCCGSCGGNGHRRDSANNKETHQ